MDNQNEISRRTFMKGMGGVVAAATVLGLAGEKSKAMAEAIPQFVTLPKTTLLAMYKKMQRIRQGELVLREMHTEMDRKYFYPTTGLRGAAHTSAGEEATCVGVCTAMQKGDYLTGGHRSHGYPLALGLDLNSWMAELMGKVTGSNRGHGGSMHIGDPAVGILGMTGIVAHGVPIAVGAAIASQIEGTKKVAVATTGDGAMNASAYNSSLNMAAVYNAPVVFIINDNMWASSRPSRWEQSLVKAGKDLSVRASGYGIPGITVDGNDVFAVYKAAKFCIESARQGKGPSLLECVTYRQWAHSGPIDHEVTRWPFSDLAEFKGELEYWLNRDPIKRFETVVLSGKLLIESDMYVVRKEVADELKKAVDFGINSPFPNPEDEFKDMRKIFGA